jgi:hypothetical protein
MNWLEISLFDPDIEYGFLILPSFSIFTPSPHPSPRNFYVKSVKCPLPIVDGNYWVATSFDQKMAQNRFYGFYISAHGPGYAGICGNMREQAGISGQTPQKQREV